MLIIMEKALVYVKCCCMCGWIGGKNKKGQPEKPQKSVKVVCDNIGEGKQKKWLGGQNRLEIQRSEESCRVVVQLIVQTGTIRHTRSAANLKNLQEVPFFAEV